MGPLGHDGRACSTDFSAWIGRSEQREDPMSVVVSLAAHATLDEPGVPPGPGDALPLPWHWFHFLDLTPQVSLDANGHARLGGFMPPVPYPRRMFAGARIKRHRPLVVGSPAVRDSTIRNVALKTGRSGPMAFVTVAHRFTQAGVLCVEEEQDLVYREHGPRVAAPVPRVLPDLPSTTWSFTCVPDARLLFRFSALTFNAHLIHYDRDFCRDVDGYPGLVVHGPLTATLLLQLVRRNTPRPVIEFSFRALNPLFDLGPVRLSGVLEGDSVTMQAQGPDGVVAMTATATLG